jgi:phenylalanyl-tRNA synthetase beta chain
MNNGIRPINSILDQLAYITLLTNVPTAVYDADKITNNLSIQLAKDKEEILGFDKQRYKLTDTDIVVKSDENTIGLAGIIGASEYGMSNETKDILIEAANFNFINIRKTAFRLNIQTDAAKRFSRKISIYLNRLALKLICEQFANYQISYPVVAFKEQVPLTIPMDYDFINRFIGINLTKQAIQDNLQYYGFRFKDDQCIPPLNRLDVVSIQDISEEVLKFIDINELPTTPITGEINTTQTNCHYRLLCKLKALLNSNYINEVKTYNLTSELDLNEMNVFKYANNIKIENAHHPSRAYLRTNLIDQLLKVYQFNDSYKTTLVPIFELQKIYYDSKHSLNLTIIASGKIYIDRIVGSQILVNVN